MILYAFSWPTVGSMCLQELLERSWDKAILPNPDLLPAFWELQKKHPAYIGHPVSKRKNAFKHCIPLLLHVDGTPVTGLSKIWHKQLTIHPTGRFKRWFFLLGFVEDFCLGIRWGPGVNHQEL